MYLIDEPHEIEMTPKELLSYISDDLVSSRYRLGYRGVKNGRWNLSPTLTRYLSQVRAAAHKDYTKHANFNQDVVDVLYRNFKSNVTINNDIKDSNISDLELWQLGQHYGLPSPLLDWSYSPYVALFFSLLEKQTADDVSMNMYHGASKVAEEMPLNNEDSDKELSIDESSAHFRSQIDNMLDDKTRDHFNQKYADDEPLCYEMKAQHLSKQIVKSKREDVEGIEKCPRCIWVIDLELLKIINDSIKDEVRHKMKKDFGDGDLENRYPSFDEIEPQFNSSNKRIIYQQGFFTFHRNYWSFDSWIRQVSNWLEHDCSEHPLITKINFYITDAERSNTLDNLSKMNINYRTLFPDIEGSVKDAKDRTIKGFMKQPFIPYSLDQSQEKKEQLTNNRRFKGFSQNKK
jgi:hypothetical protein